MLPGTLQHTVESILTHFDKTDTKAMDSADILHVGELFGSLNDIHLHFARQHQRRLLLQLLTFQHLIPLWDYYLPNNRLLHDDLHTMLSLTLRRQSQAQGRHMLDQLWEHIDTYPKAPPVIDHISVGVYTTLKVFDRIENPAGGFDDYAPDTHAAVALRYAARAYVAHYTSDTNGSHYDRRFWRYWLTDIVPRAWFALSEDTL